MHKNNSNKKKNEQKEAAEEYGSFNDNHVPVARGVFVAAADGVRAAERHDFAVVEAHAVEDVAQVLRGGELAAHVGVGQATVGRRSGACKPESEKKRETL
jgi:hypothetical protein